MTHGLLAINILAHEQEALSSLFGSSRYDMEARFNAGTWRKGEIGMPILEGALVSLECRISLTQEIGTHSVFFVEPLCAEFTRQETSGLVWFDRAIAGPDSAPRALAPGQTWSRRASIVSIWKAF
nr:flavin reductase [Asaia astilbis]